MLCERLADGVILRAPAKVNLFLEVLGKRADGYHEIATLMVAVGLDDTLELTHEPGGEIRLSCDDPQLDCGPGNLISRAAQLLRQRTGVERGAAIRLQKRIPVAAGLAGGSTDAAATLAGLNELWNLGLSKTELMALGSELGSDIAFFGATPAAWCTGRGEQVEPVPLGRELWFVIVCPAVGLSTAEVYRRVVVPAEPRSGTEIRQALGAGDVEEIGRQLHNRLQASAWTLGATIERWLRRLEGQGPAGALMSGSGSSVFALCRDREEASRIARAMHDGRDEEPNRGIFVVRSTI